MNDKQPCVYTQVTSKMSWFNWIPAFAGMTESKCDLMQKLLSGEWHIKTGLPAIQGQKKKHVIPAKAGIQRRHVIPARAGTCHER